MTSGVSADRTPGGVVFFRLANGFVGIPYRPPDRLEGRARNGISPGGVFGPPNVVEGGVLRVLPQEIQEAIRAWHEGGWTPMGRLGTPEDIGNAVMLLCMDEASFITGQILHVDGGGSIMDTVLPLDIQRG